MYCKCCYKEPGLGICCFGDIEASSFVIIIVVVVISLHHNRRLGVFKNNSQAKAAVHRHGLRGSSGPHTVRGGPAQVRMSCFITIFFFFFIFLLQRS